MADFGKFDNIDDLVGDVQPKATKRDVLAAKRALEDADAKQALEAIFSLPEQVKVFKSVLDGVYNGSGAARAAMTKIYKDAIPLYATQEGITEVVSFAPPPVNEPDEEPEDDGNASS